MIKNFVLLFLVSIMFCSCNKEEEEPRVVNFAVFFESICSESFSILCVSREEFRRIQEVFETNQNGPDLDCLPVTVTDLEGTVHEGFLRGFSSTGADIPCIQQEDII